MGYLQEFKTRITNVDSTGVLQLWEEYCAGDQVDAVELCEILRSIKDTPLARNFGQHAEAAIRLWELEEDDVLSHSIIRSILDVQNTNTEEFAQIAYDVIKEKYSHHDFFNEKIRLIGLRSKEEFQGAITNYELLTHLAKGKHVFHNAGWGTGEIIEISLVREELVLEFELVLGRRDITFANAFKNLIPLPDDHFLSRRFGDADNLERESRDNPVSIIRMLLRDLGPKSAAEIKDELFELVIPAEDWTKWWQSARARIKKDTMIATPSNIKKPFHLREEELSHEERFQKTLQDKSSPSEVIQTMYQFTRDFPETLKNAEFKLSLKEKLLSLLSDHSLSTSLLFQIHIFLENNFTISLEEKSESLPEFVQKLENLEAVIDGIEIIAFKKRALVAIREYREDWSEIFLSTLLNIQQSVLRDYLLKELHQGDTKIRVHEKLTHLVESPTLYPEAYVWYFQKVIAGKDDSLPYFKKDGQCRLFESFLILYHYLEQAPETRDLVKKMYATLSGDRYACVRNILQDSNIEYVQEILLLVTKCQTLSSHDIKILHSLAEVVHPSLSTKKREEKADLDANVIWTTPEGYDKIKSRIHHIGTIETVENAKEIEAARALGDLRENSEYKFALEKRSRLQGELKLLSDQVNKARILTKEDIQAQKAGVGTIVDIETPQGDAKSYTILGPWDADPEKGVLSFQSKLAQTMSGVEVGESFSFQGEEYFVKSLKSYL
ncbi:MAG: transcription elongation factor GreA-like protein/transcription elongation GreA/GreB family factor [Chlamydiales bacterium]|jgi:transcription elongation factor GreA-like protein/transcription elongation GreA/GreB family factor